LSQVSAATDDTYTSSTVSMSCLIYDSLSFFDFRDMANYTDNYSIVDDTTGDTIYFNLCAYTVASDSVAASCTEGHSVFAYKVDSEGTCVELTDNQVSSVVETIDSSMIYNVVSLNISGGEQCDVVYDGDVYYNYTFTIEVQCDADAESTDPVKVVNVTTGDHCDIKVAVSSATGCPIFSAMSWFRVLFGKVSLAGPVLIVLGILMSLVGLKFFKYTIGIFGALLGCGTTFLLFFMI
jgi:hypothetical protein